MADFHPANSIKPSSFKDEHGLDEESLIAIQSTLGVLSSLSSSGDSFAFSPSSFTLLSSSSNIQSSPPSKALSFLRSLLLSTTQSATSNSSSSYLAGPSNESDDYGDVAIYLCPSSSSSPSLGKEGSEKDILSLMGLGDLTKKESLSIKPYSIPKTSHSQFVDQLEDKYAFRVEGASEGGTVLFVLVGRYESDWVGLVGLGVWT